MPSSSTPTTAATQAREPADIAAALFKLSEQRRDSAIPHCDLATACAEVDVSSTLLADISRTARHPTFADNDKAQTILHFLGTRLRRRVVAARAVIDRLQKDRISNLPTELLIDIVTRITNGASTVGLEGDDHVASEAHNRTRDVATIKALRLTSRRMRNLANGFLIRTVTVKMMPESMGRLDEISRHPVFSQTVRCVRVNLAFYAQVLAAMENAVAYEKHQRDRIRDRFHVASSKASLPGAQVISVRTDTLLNRLRHEALATRMDSGSTRQSKKGGNCHASLQSSLGRLLRSSQAEYNRLYHEQQRVRNRYGCGGGYDYPSSSSSSSSSFSSFVADIATAMARMRHATRLEISDLDVPLDWEENYERKTPERLDKHTQLYKLMTAPMRWEVSSTSLDEWPGAPVGVLLALPVALAKQGLRLTRFAVSITPPRLVDWPTLNPTDDDAHQLAELVRDIRVVEFTMKSQDHDVAVIPAQWPEGQAHLKPIAAYLSAILCTSRLEKLRLGIGAFRKEMMGEWGDLMRWPLLSTLLQPQAWPRLERLELDNVTVTPCFLERLIGERSADMILRLERVFIRENQGTWREMLDMLRLKADPLRIRAGGGDVCGLVFVETIFAPYGGEMVDFISGDIERIFGSRRWLDDKAPLSPALLYLRGLRSKNPVPMVIGTPPPTAHLHVLVDFDDYLWNVGL